MQLICYWPVGRPLEDNWQGYSCIWASFNGQLPSLFTWKRCDCSARSCQLLCLPCTSSAIYLKSSTCWEDHSKGGRHHPSVILRRQRRFSITWLQQKGRLVERTCLMIWASKTEDLYLYEIVVVRSYVHCKVQNARTFWALIFLSDHVAVVRLTQNQTG